jgi:[glutamine synthetase] adenylyltransferase / [glutamine synthetase]-adenylyl-L-tyrosine phosphorylase
VSRPRREGGVARLARLGFVAGEAEQRLAGTLAGLPWSVLSALSEAADPDLALRALDRLVEHCPEPEPLLQALRDNAALRERLSRVLGASDALGQHLAHHPDDWQELADPQLSSVRPSAAGLRTRLLEAVGADPASEAPVATEPDPRAVDQLRAAYRRLLLGLAARDLTAGLAVDDVAAELADLAAAALESALAIARAQVGPAARSCRLAVIGMGKCGGRELNYVSDVDVVFVAEPVDRTQEEAALRTATALATAMIRCASAHTGEGTLWPVDVSLRPEGRAGPLVRSLDSHLGYYRRWAKTWEFQALVKARAVAGDQALGRRYEAAIQPLVWQAADREGFVEDVQAMRRRVVDQLGPESSRELKLGPGGLRDVEFAVQLLQLVHGRSDPTLRSGSTLAALGALTDGGYVGRSDGAALAAAYRFLRTLEHRIQLWQLRRTHAVPGDTRALRRLGRSLGYLEEPVQELTEQLGRHSREVRRLHEKLFYRPLLTAVARLPADEARLSPDAAEDRLAALGYADPVAALRHLEALTSGVSRRAAIQRTLLPVMLHWFARAPGPDAALLAFRQVSDALGSTHWYLRLLRDEGAVAERMARVLSTSRYATDLLMRGPEAVALLADNAELTPRPRDQLSAQMAAAVGRHDDPADAIAAVRAVRRRELLRISAADVLGDLDVEAVGAALTDLTLATLDAALLVATEAVTRARGGRVAARIAVVAMGRLGGHELGYASDADVMFVHEPVGEAAEAEATSWAHAVASETRRLLAEPGPDPGLDVDTALRPEGRQGPLVRSLSSYASYYARWSHAWEAQALLRAEAACGDGALRQRFTALIEPLRWPAGGLTESELREIRRIKARVDAERLPRGADPATHLKLGRGALADVEWTVQLLQLRHAGQVPDLRTTRTMQALGSATASQLIAADDAAVLRDAWRLAMRLRNAVMLVRGRPSESLPRDARERAAVAYLCGYRPDEGARVVEDYLRATRRARAVIDRLFWG